MECTNLNKEEQGCEGAGGTVGATVLRKGGEGGEVRKDSGKPVHRQLGPVLCLLSLPSPSQHPDVDGALQEKHEELSGNAPSVCRDRVSLFQLPSITQEPPTLAISHLDLPCTSIS